MAHAHVSTYAQDLAVKLGDEEIHINCGPFSIRMDRESAAHLAADLLDAVEALPVEAQQVSA